MGLRFRKRPVVIEAFQMTLERHLSNEEWPAWLHEAYQRDYNDPGALYRSATSEHFCIYTLEGVHVVNVDDWIVRGIRGELYPVKPDIFAATYEEEIAL